MGLCACENQKKKPIQVQEKQAVNPQTNLAAPVKSNDSGNKPNVLHASSFKPLSTKYSQFFDLRDNPQNLFFMVSRSFKAIKVKRISDQENDGNMYTFFKNGAIPHGEIIEFSLIQITKDNIFNIGIGTKATFGDKAPDDTIKYQSKQLWIDNKKCFIDNQMFNIPQLQTNSCLKVIVNTREWIIEWFIDGTHVASKQIPLKMKSKNFYLTLALYNNQDEVQFLQE